MNDVDIVALIDEYRSRNRFSWQDPITIWSPSWFRDFTEEELGDANAVASKYLDNNPSDIPTFYLVRNGGFISIPSGAIDMGAIANDGSVASLSLSSDNYLKIEGSGDALDKIMETMGYTKNPKDCP